MTGTDSATHRHPSSLEEGPGVVAARSGAREAIIRNLANTTPTPPLKRRGFHVALALTLIPASATAQTPTTTYDRAIAAGYKAATYCSAIFNSGRKEADIDAVELKGIYPQYVAIVPTLTAQVDRNTATVTVPFDDQLPPRRAVWHEGTGCTNEPIGAAPSPMPKAYATPPGPAPADPRPWPLGDSLPRIAMPAIAPVATAFDAATYGKGTHTTGVIILKGNRLIAERYAEGFGPFTSQRTWSVAKSITGTLVGIASRDGTAKVDEPARIHSWQDEAPASQRRSITLDQLLRMSSGLHDVTAGNRTDAVYFGGTSVDEVTVGLPLTAKPGTRFRYANNDTMLAMRSLRTTLGEARYKDFPEKALFAPLGMTHSVAETDWQGNFISSSQMWTSARDLARFGLLYLKDGVWNGQRILPEGWIKYVTTPKSPQPDGDFGYGATFWLLNKSPGIPTDTYGAFGNRGQYVIVVPSRDMVIVRRAEDPAGSPFDIAKFTADVLAAVK